MISSQDCSDWQNRNMNRNTFYELPATTIRNTNLWEEHIYKVDIIFSTSENLNTTTKKPIRYMIRKGTKDSENVFVSSWEHLTWRREVDKNLVIRSHPCHLLQRCSHGSDQNRQRGRCVTIFCQIEYSTFYMLQHGRGVCQHKICLNTHITFIISTLPSLHIYSYVMS